MICMIAGNGALEHPAWLKRFVTLESPDFIIAADGGFDHLSRAGVTPHMLVGDMDSISGSPGSNLTEVVTFPKEKDFTDLELALDIAIGKGAERILLVGVTGNRMDHSLANILLLRKFAEIGIEIEIHDEQHVFFIIEKTRILHDCQGMLFSLLPLDPVVDNIRLLGFKYPLEDETLVMGDTRGVSNVILSSPCSIEAGNGLLLGVLTKTEA